MEYMKQANELLECIRLMLRIALYVLAVAGCVAILSGGGVVITNQPDAIYTARERSGSLCIIISNVDDPITNTEP